jgi:hypothetical protein
VRFYLIFPSGVRTGETFVSDLVEHLDPFGPLFHDAQAVITQVRLQAPSGSRAETAPTHIRS